MPLLGCYHCTVVLGHWVCGIYLSSFDEQCNSVHVHAVHWSVVP